MNDPYNEYNESEQFVSRELMGKASDLIHSFPFVWERETLAASTLSMIMGFGRINTLQDMFMWIIILGIGIMGERKYGDFFRNPQISYPKLNCLIFTLNYFREIKISF